MFPNEFLSRTFAVAIRRYLICITFWRPRHCSKKSFAPPPHALSPPYCIKDVLSLTHMLILDVRLTRSMHGLYTSTQHLEETLKPFNWIRVRPLVVTSTPLSACMFCKVFHLRSVNTRDSSHINVLYFICIPSSGSLLNLGVLKTREDVFFHLYVREHYEHRELLETYEKIGCK